MATVKVGPDAAKQLAKLPRVIRQQIDRILKRLEAWPIVSGAKPLTGNLAGSYRLRTRDYRLRFRVQGDTVIVDKIGHRKDFYED